MSDSPFNTTSGPQDGSFAHGAVSGDPDGRGDDERVSRGTFHSMAVTMLELEAKVKSLESQLAPMNAEDWGDVSLMLTGSRDSSYDSVMDALRYRIDREEYIRELESQLAAYKAGQQRILDALKNVDQRLVESRRETEHARLDAVDAEKLAETWRLQAEEQRGRATKLELWNGGLLSKLASKERDLDAYEAKLSEAEGMIRKAGMDPQTGRFQIVDEALQPPTPTAMLTTSRPKSVGRDTHSLADEPPTPTGSKE